MSAPAVAAAGVFDRIVVGLDGSPESFGAARQAAALRSPGGSLELCVVVESAKSVHAGFLAPIVVHEIVQTANDVLDRAAIVTRPTTKTLCHGRPIARLLEQVTQREATYCDAVDSPDEYSVAARVSKTAPIRPSTATEEAP